MDDARTNTALDRLTLEVTERVRSSCLNLSEAELLSLAVNMATLELKYLGRASTTLGERRTLVVDG